MRYREGRCSFTREGRYSFKKLALWCAVCLIVQSCLILCNLMDCSPPGSSVHGILQARILEWAAISSPGGLPNPVIETASLALQAGFFTAESLGKP